MFVAPLNQQIRWKMSKSIQLKINGMTCSSCVSRVEKALLKVEGAEQARVNLANETATVEGAPQTSALISAVEQAGYQVATTQVQYTVGGMTCASCVLRVEKAVQQLPQVLDAKVNLASEKLTLTLLSELAVAEVADILHKAGYQLIMPLKSDETSGQNNENKTAFYQADWFPVLASALLTLPLVLPMLFMPFNLDWMLPAWVQWLLATPVQFYFGRRFYRAGWGALKAGTGNMDLLVAIGTTAAYGLSLYLCWTSRRPPSLF